MNKREVGKLLHAPRKISNCFKDREEELSFFRDLHKREKNQVASLLQPVSEEFEANGNYGLYKLESGGTKGPALGFLAESGKNDYNWLKTPPATPLFTSLEMEANGQDLVIMQRELPITQPLSRFAGNPQATKTSTNRSTSPNPKPRLPQTHKTPTGRPTISSSIDKKNMKTAPIVQNHKTNNTTNNTLVDKTKPNFTPVVKSTPHKEPHTTTFLASNLSKSMGSLVEPNSNAKAKSTRGVSPFARSKILGLSDETPPNLRTTTNRPASATRGRPLMNQNLTSNVSQKQESSTKMIRRQSCSPSVTRDRKVENNDNAVTQTSNSSSSGNIRGQVLGSRMVDKFMNARISSVGDRQMKTTLSGSIDEKSRISIGHEERRGKIKLNGPMDESSAGFGRLMSKNSLDMALKHMEFQRDPSNIRKHGAVPVQGRNS